MERRDGGGKNGTENEGKRVSGIWWSSTRQGERERMNRRKWKEIAEKIKRWRKGKEGMKVEETE